MICKIIFASKYLQFSESGMYSNVMGFYTSKRKNLCVYSYYEVSIYRYKFVLFIKVLPDVFSFPNTPNVINTSLRWKCERKVSALLAKIRMNIVLCIQMSRRENMKLMTLETSSVFSLQYKYGSNTYFWYRKPNQCQMCPYCNCACVQVNV